MNRFASILGPLVCLAVTTMGADDGGRVLSYEQTIHLWGHDWVAHTANTGKPEQPAGVTIFDNEVRFRAATGEFVSEFDPPDGRKIRAELCGLTRFEKGKRFKAAFTFLIPPGQPAPDLEWHSLFQIHAADVRNARGAPLIGSPLFSLEIMASSKSPTGELLLVRGETSTGDGTTWPTIREFAQVPFMRGIDHKAEIEVVDSHGTPGGLVRVVIDGKTIVSQPNIPTGYTFVDLPILLGGKPQDNRSYPKLGIYAGNSEHRPSGMVLETVIRDLTMSVER